MARETRIIDDLSGVELTGSGVEPTTITIDGTDYTIDLGPDSVAHLTNWLSGTGAYAYQSVTRKRYEDLENRYNALVDLASKLNTSYTGDDEVPDAVQDFLTGYKKVVDGGAPSSKTPKADSNGTTTTRIRLTGEASERFKKDTEEFKANKAAQRASIYKFAKTTDKHKGARDSGKNIPTDLVADFYAANPDEVRYYGADKVQPPSNKNYA